MPATPATATPSDRLTPLTPKSLLRHRPIAPAPERTTQEPPAVPRASRTIHRKPAQPAPKPHPAASPTDVPTWKVASTTGHASAAWQVRLVPGIAVGVALAVVLVLAQLLIGWLGNTWNELHYGSPRTYQVDAMVGHNDSVAHPSHFLALNLHGQIDIVEFPGGDVSHARVYVGPQLSGPQAALVPVTLRFVTPAHASLPNMIVLVGSSQFLFVNAHGTFLSPGT